MEKCESIRVIVHMPETKIERQQLAREIADIYAEYITIEIDALKCPAEQKMRIMETIIDQLSENSYKK